MSNEINQSHIRHDPASTKTDFPDRREGGQSKQPGSIPTVAGEDDAARPAPGKYNTRDEGHGEAVTDIPVKDIEDHADKE